MYTEHQKKRNKLQKSAKSSNTSAAKEKIKIRKLLIQFASCIMCVLISSVEKS